MTGTRELTDNFSLLIHKDDRVNGETVGDVEIKYNGDLA